MKAKIRTNQPVEFENYDIDGDVEITGDLDVGGAIKQSEPNYEIEFNLPSLPEGLTFGEHPYKKAIVVNNILYYVLEFEIYNSTSSAISTGTLTFTNNNIPTEIGSKLVRRNGTKVSEAGGSGDLVLCVVDGAVDTSIVPFVVRSGQANSLGSYFQPQSIPANSRKPFSVRAFLTLF